MNHYIERLFKDNVDLYLKNMKNIYRNSNLLFLSNMY